MNKTFFITILSCFAVYLFYIYHRFVPSLVSYYIPINKSNSSSMVMVLEDLSNAPVIGHFFVEEAIFHSAIQKNWNKVLNLAEGAVDTPVNENKFTIWYHKALAQCLLKQYDKCQESARVANSLTKAHQEYYLSHLFDLIKISRKSKNLVFTQESEQIKVYNKPETQMSPQNQEESLVYEQDYIQSSDQLLISQL